MEMLETNLRNTARVIGISLFLMAILAGISFPKLGSLTASIGLTLIFLLDLIVSIGIYIFHVRKNKNLTIITSVSRIAYSFVFGIGICFHFDSNVQRFNQIFESGLILFGIHLISLGLLFNEACPKNWMKWMIKYLLLSAGFGYIFLNTSKFAFGKESDFIKIVQYIFILPMIFGEIFYATWMILFGGKFSSEKKSGG